MTLKKIDSLSSLKTLLLINEINFELQFIYVFVCFFSKSYIKKNQT